MRISDWSSDVCSSDLLQRAVEAADLEEVAPLRDRQQEAAVEEGAVQAVLAELLGERQQRLHEARLQQALRLRRIVASDTLAPGEGGMVQRHRPRCGNVVPHAAGNPRAPRAARTRERVA